MEYFTFHDIIHQKCVSATCPVWKYYQIIAYSGFSYHISSLLLMNPHIVRIIIVENEYQMHKNKGFVGINM